MVCRVVQIAIALRAAYAATVFSATSPTTGNQTLLISGYQLDSVSSFQVCSLSGSGCTALIPAAQADVSAAALTVPSGAAVDVWRLSLDGDTSADNYVNYPEVQWVLGSGSREGAVEAGSTLHLVGRALWFSPGPGGDMQCQPLTAASQPQSYRVVEEAVSAAREQRDYATAAALLRGVQVVQPAASGSGSSGKSEAAAVPVVTLISTTSPTTSYSVPVTLASCYRIDVNIPASIPPGDYSLRVTNGLPSAVIFAGLPVSPTVTVIAPDAWPTRSFTVGADCPDPLSCVAAAQAAGGGNVLLPPGQYVMPAGAVLNVTGAGSSTSSGVTVQAAVPSTLPTLVWPSNVVAPPALVSCGGYGRLDGVQLLATSAVEDLVTFRELSVGCAVQNSVLTITPPPVMQVGSAFTAYNASRWSFTNNTVTHAVQASPGVFSNCTRSWPHNCLYYFAKVWEANFSGNTMIAGCQGYSVMDSSRLFSDANSMISVGTDSQGDGYSNFESPAVLENVYIGRSLDVGNPAAAKRWESMTSDGPGCAAFSRVAAYTVAPDGNSSTITLQDAGVGNLQPSVGMLVAIMGGVGRGQMARLVSWNNATNEYTLDRALPGPLAVGAATANVSIVSILAYRGRYTFEGNAWLNDTTFQYFGTTVDAVAAGQYMQELAAGMMGWGRMYQGGWQPCYNVLFESNVLRCSEGGGLQVVSSLEPTPVPPFNYTVFYNSVQVWRRNQLIGGSGINVQGAGTSDVVLEQNPLLPGPCSANNATQHPAGSMRIDPAASNIVIRD